jgi:hypothetical protein
MKDTRIQIGTFQTCLGWDGIFFLLFSYTAILSRIGELELDRVSGPPTFGPDFGTKDPLLIVWRLREYQSIDSWRNDPTALSLLNKVCNSI